MTNLNLGFRILREQLEERLKINLHQNFEGYTERYLSRGHKGRVHGIGKDTRHTAHAGG